MHDYTPWVGLPAERPHACLRLCERVYRECYGIDVAAYDAGIEERDLAVRLLRVLESQAERVDAAKEGDLIVMLGTPVHIGIVTQPGWMLHVFNEDHSVIARYTDQPWRQAVRGFYRWRSAVSS